MSGMDANTGRLLSERDHIKQSLRDIIKTSIGSRLLSRDYGSMVNELIDQPFSTELFMQMRSAIVIAITQHEPRVRLERVIIELDQSAEGRVVITNEIMLRDTGEIFTDQLLM